MLKLYNTEEREKISIAPPKEGPFTLYTCGPTIYDFAHIGNFRTYVVEDLLRRVLKYFGFSVKQAMNITDVDDKTIQGAIQKNISLREYTEPFRIAFFEDLRSLFIEEVEYYPKATDYIPQMIQMIETLLEKGMAYKTDKGSIYFSIEKFPSYGRLSHLDFSALKVNASGENEADEYHKESASDFVLWKSYEEKRDGQVFWESPFGRGRPGWHIECSAMAKSLLGDTIDLHCGGVDNMFPHHENEIAQSECCTNKPFVRHWFHVEHLLIEGRKMSKRLGNFYTLKDLVKKGYSGLEVRYLLLSTHYRMQLNFTLTGLEAARSSLARIEDFLLRLNTIREEKPEQGLLERFSLQFDAALQDDLNISLALSVKFALIREYNTLADQNRLGKAEAQKILSLFSRWDRILGIIPFPTKKSDSPPEHLLELLKKRNRAREAKNWGESDLLRDQISKEGYLIEDTAEGSRLKKRDNTKQEK